MQIRLVVSLGLIIEVARMVHKQAN